MLIWESRGEYISNIADTKHIDFFLFFSLESLQGECNKLRMAWNLKYIYFYLQVLIAHEIFQMFSST